MEELELFFLDKIKPYEERIHKLEDSERQKEYEITTLKHAIHNLNRMIEDVKTKQGAASKSQTANPRNPTAGKGTPATTTAAAAGNKPGARPGAPHAAPAKTDAAKPGSVKKDTKVADPKKTGKNTKTDKPAEEEAAEEAPAETNEKKEEETVQSEEGASEI